MHYFLDSFIEKIERLFVCADIGVDEGRRRIIFALCLVIFIPIVCLLGIDDLGQSHLFEGTLVLSTGIILIINLILLRYLSEVRWVFRSSALVSLMILTYEIHIGGGDGYAFVWLYFYPIALLYMFGKKEGLFWVFLSIFNSFSLISLGWAEYQYPASAGIRFLISYMVVSILAYALESARDRYYNQLLQEKMVLEDAFQQIKTLKGLIPICASCKKIRDDQGYWKEIEIYIRKHSEAEFSHSICPECYRQYGFEDEEPFQ